VQEIAQASGTEGMIGGQTMDISLRERESILRAAIHSYP